jgi:hypothetical protein
MDTEDLWRVRFSVGIRIQGLRSNELKLGHVCGVPFSTWLIGVARTRIFKRRLTKGCGPHTHTHTYTHIHTHTQTYTRSYKYTHTYTHIHTNTYTFICTHTHTYSP